MVRISINTISLELGPVVADYSDDSGDIEYWQENGKENGFTAGLGYEYDSDAFAFKLPGNLPFTKITWDVDNFYTGGQGAALWCGPTAPRRANSNNIYSENFYPWGDFVGDVPMEELGMVTEIRTNYIGAFGRETFSVLKFPESDTLYAGMSSYWGNATGSTYAIWNVFLEF